MSAQATAAGPVLLQITVEVIGLECLRLFQVDLARVLRHELLPTNPPGNGGTANIGLLPISLEPQDLEVFGDVGACKAALLFLLQTDKLQT